MNMASMPMYQAEVSNSARGFLVLLECGLIATGTSMFDIVSGAYSTLTKCSVIVLAELRSPQLYNLSTSMTWRFPIAFQIVLALFYIFGLFFLPESPRWYLSPDGP